MSELCSQFENENGMEAALLCGMFGHPFLGGECGVGDDAIAELSAILRFWNRDKWVKR